jgi:hypothetical protein
MKIELIVDELLKMLFNNENDDEQSLAKRSSVLDRFRDISSELRRTFSDDDTHVLFLTRTTCIAFHVDNRRAKRSPDATFQHVPIETTSSLTRVNLPAVSRARLISFARRKYFVHLQLINRSAVSNDWASSIQMAAV